MKGSWKLGEFFGIGVFVHWTFLILIAWVAGTDYLNGETLAAALEGIAFVLALFACVVAHEYGHALTARRYGIATQDITLLPIGGVARLERMPDEPRQELAVALAGPLVNVVIAAGLFGALQLLGGLSEVSNLALVTGNFMTNLLAANLFLVVFNLLPAFPMDGGRVLRALLATRLDYVRATNIAATIGQGMAILFGLLAPFTNLFLLFIALFVYLGAQQEAQHVQVRGLLRGVPVRAAMMTRFHTVTEDDRLPAVLEELLAGYQQDFPVLDGDRVVGVLTRGDLLNALAQRGHDARVGDVMHRVCDAVEQDAMLEDTFARMREGQCATLPVVQRGRLVGLINLENVGEWMMIQTALRSGGSPGEVEDAVQAA